MSASPTTATAPSQKRPLEEPSSPSGPGDQPDAKRPALDKVVKEESTEQAPSAPEPATASAPSESAKSEPEAPVPAAQNGTKDGQGDTVVPDAPTSAASAAPDTQPIQSTSTANGPSTAQPASSGHQDESNWLHVRAIISSAEAATVIGKGGENVTQIRRMSGAKCTVSDYSRGAVERILTVSGLVDAVAKVSGSALPSVHGVYSQVTGIRFDYPHAEQ